MVINKIQISAERNGNPVQNVDELIEYLQVLNVFDLVRQTQVEQFEAGSGRLYVDIFWGPRVESKWNKFKLLEVQNTNY